MTINQHYNQQLETDAVLARVRQQYPQGASLYQLAPLDQLHIGGIKASERLLRHLDPERHRQVLDIGSGAGGLMRQAALAGINMIGLDITHDLNRLNQGLNGCLEQPVTTPVLTSDAHHLPFADNSIDLILFQHSLLNMPDDVQVLQECRRVLKRDGQLLLHEVVEGEHPGAMRFPVPWADDAKHSHLLSQSALAARLQAAGFGAIEMDDWSNEALTWRRRQLEKEQADSSAPAPLSPALILGNRFKAMGQNVAINLEKGAIRVLECLTTPA
ncbi:class I SAM-dependent methyltransferase [Marinobacterium weihaiense]|uniref:Class I SAM-dependent methyltransferase n=1 Tax=Marinobacterium weihaiense TaxID=2851016 RepID=A0ABS6MED8_9GAMM|nr:class I SAM-dependent methyltransferase [Marinobacterium weihaiense]MBV0934653.1 class I SAM-dependent methyltransferase [Marinobacterium weihaiense]